MIIELSDSTPPQIAEPERVDQLHATVAGDEGRIVFNEFCSPGPDSDHVWIDVANLRAAVLARVDDPGHADLIREAVDGLTGEDPPAGWRAQSGGR